MKQIKLMLLAGTVISGAASIALAQEAAIGGTAPFILAQAPPNEIVVPGDVPPADTKGKDRPRGEQKQQRQEQKQERGGEQKQLQKQEIQQEQKQERPMRPPVDAPPVEKGPPPVEKLAPPVEKGPPPVEKLDPYAAPQKQPREEKQLRREEMKQQEKQPVKPPVPPVVEPVAPPPPPVVEPVTPPVVPPPVKDPATSPPVVDPVPPPDGGVVPPPSSGAGSPPIPDNVNRPPAAGAPPVVVDTPAAPSVAPEPPPAGEKPAIPPEELKGGKRTPDQQRRSEERADQDFRGRDKKMDERFGRQIEQERDGRTVIREKDDRVIIRDGDRTIIRSDENRRLGRNAEDVRTERRGRENVTVITRPGGVEIITVTDEDGNLIRRSRRQGGREIVLIDNQRVWEREGRWNRDSGWRGDRGREGGFNIDFYVDVPPVRVGIPREEYIIDSDDAGYDDYYEALEAPPLVRSERPYSLQEVTQNVRLRERVRSIDLNSITFATGEWTVAQDQIPQLEDIARAMQAVIDQDPTQVYLIEGHTDAVGSNIDNLSLSDRRAEEVAAILTEYYRIPAENLVTQGYGEDYLKVNTLAANPDNRRVTIRNITQLLGAQASAR